jgi:hypothetical protein
VNRAVAVASSRRVDSALPLWKELADSDPDEQGLAGNAPSGTHGPFQWLCTSTIELELSFSAAVHAYTPAYAGRHKFGEAAAKIYPATLAASFLTRQPSAR